MHIVHMQTHGMVVAKYAQVTLTESHDMRAKHLIWPSQTARLQYGTIKHDRLQQHVSIRVY